MELTERNFKLALLDPRNIELRKHIEEDYVSPRDIKIYFNDTELNFRIGVKRNPNFAYGYPYTLEIDHVLTRIKVSELQTFLSGYPPLGIPTILISIFYILAFLYFTAVNIAKEFSTLYQIYLFIVYLSGNFFLFFGLNSGRSLLNFTIQNMIIASIKYIFKFNRVSNFLIELNVALSSYINKDRNYE